MSDADLVGDFEFDGSWREYAPIAFTNLLLTIVTLGIYRFWGTTRTRRYLWSRTSFLGDRLEWAGTGMELFKGALMALLLLILPGSLVNFLARELMLGGHPALGGLLSFALALSFYVLIGTAMFRALRYRLSRSYWRGIRGGSADPGLRYGFAYVWKNFIGALALGLLMPWAMVSLWNQRWSAMSFGPWRFAAEGRVKGLKRRFLLCYLAPILGVGVAGAVMWSGAVVTFFGAAPTNPVERLAMFLPAIFGFYFVFGLVAMAYYAKFFRQMVASTSLNTVHFRFSATTMDWMELYLGDAALVIFTLGIGLIFLNYRHWKFYVKHLQTEGTIDVEALTQSTAPAPTQGEGLLDAFDMGAF